MCKNSRRRFNEKSIFKAYTVTFLTDFKKEEDFFSKKDFKEILGT